MEWLSYWKGTLSERRKRDFFKASWVVTRILQYFVRGILDRKFPTWESPFLPLLRSGQTKMKTLETNPYLSGLTVRVLRDAAVNISRCVLLPLNQNTPALVKRATTVQRWGFGTGSSMCLPPLLGMISGLAIKRAPFSTEFREADELPNTGSEYASWSWNSHLQLPGFPVKNNQVKKKRVVLSNSASGNILI